MQPVGSSSSGSYSSKCVETSSKCVVWDGPDIKCLGVNLCKGQSIETVLYHTAKTLCEVLDSLNISPMDLACLAPTVPGTGPNTANELFQLIINKLCELNQEVIDLQNTGTAPIVVPLPDCSDIIAGCPNSITLEYPIPDPNNPAGPPIIVTSLVLIDPVTNTSPAVAYLAEVICQLLCRMSTAEADIFQLQQEVQTIISTISGALPSVNVPACISAAGTLPIADFNDPNAGAVPAIADLLCEVIDQITGDPSGGGYPVVTSCQSTDFASLPVLGNYVGGISNLGDLGAIAQGSGSLPTGDLALNELLNNMLIAICDLRNFAQIVKTTCCPALCAAVFPDIGAVIPIGAPTTRDVVRFFLIGTFTDGISNSAVTSNFDFSAIFPSPPAPGYAVGGPTQIPPKWDIHFPVVVTITDGVSTYTNNNYFLDDFVNSGSYVDFTNLGATLDTTANYTVSYTVTVAAPDGTFCTFTDSTVLSTNCDNEPVAAITVSDFSFSGFTISFTAPSPTAPTQLTAYTFILTPTVGQVITLNNIDPAYSTYYVYGAYEDHPGYPNTSPSFPNNDWVLTNLIQPNTSYSLSIIANYDCGNSIPVGYTGPPPITTLVAVEVEISNLTQGGECITPGGSGQLVLNPTLLPGQSVSANFSDPISYDGLTPRFVTLSASPGVNFAYSFSTLAIKSGGWTLNPAPGASNNCGINTLVRCWGKHTAADFYPGNTFTQFVPGGGIGLLNTYDSVGCYDYLTSAFSVVGGLTFGGAPLVTNINAGPGALNTSHGIQPYTYTAPAGSAVVGTTNGTLRIINNAHSLTLRPAINIIINDPSGYLFHRHTMWYGLSTPPDNGGSFQSNAAVEHNSQVVSKILLPAGINPGPGITKWFSTTGTNSSPVGLPIFMRLAVYTWNGSGYNPPIYPTSTVNASLKCIDVTPYWIGVGNITTTGININLPALGFNIGLRDRIEISFTGGIQNDGSNPDYPSVGISPVNPAVAVASSVTIEQNPFAGIFPDPPTTTGPYDITGASPRTLGNGISYNDALTGYPAAGGNRWGVPLNIDSAGLVGLPATAYNQPCTFVVSGDTTITWSVG
jgi:hypothetical protein